MTFILTSTSTNDITTQKLLGVNSSNAACAFDVPVASQRLIQAQVEFNGNGSPISVGDLHFWRAPCAGIFADYTLIGDQSGSVQVDVWKAVATIPDATNKLSGSNGMKITSAQLVNSADFTGWSPGYFAAGDIFGFYINSVTSFERLVMILNCSRTS